MLAKNLLIQDFAIKLIIYIYKILCFNSRVFYRTRMEDKNQSKLQLEDKTTAENEEKHFQLYIFLL